MTMTTMLACAAATTGPVLAQDPPPAQSSSSAQAGGAEFDTAPAGETPTVPGSVARIVDGIAYAPADAPDPVKRVIWAANRIIGMPYVYGGGHGDFDRPASGYDCSGTISHALHGGDLLARPRDSTAFFRYGAGGRGSWVTIFTRASHAYLTVAGVRLDTSAADDPGGGKGPRWRPLRPSDRGFKVRHPVGL
jgi:cell wall-associated NlpC family hydrolase